MVPGGYRRSFDLRQIEFNLWPLEVSFLVRVAPVFHHFLILGKWAECAHWMEHTWKYPGMGFPFAAVLQPEGGSA